MVANIDLTIALQRKKFDEKVAQQQLRLPFQLRNGIYREVASFVTPYALWKIEDQRQLYLQSTEEGGEPLKACTGGFNASMKLHGAHDIRGLLTYGRYQAIDLNDVHPHWRFSRAPGTRGGIEPLLPRPPIDPLLLVDEPAKVRGKGRPKGTLRGLSKRQITYENSAHRDPSAFEHIEVESRPIGGKGRGGRGGRGNRSGRGRGGMGGSSRATGLIGTGGIGRR